MLAHKTTRRHKLCLYIAFTSYFMGMNIGMVCHNYQNYDPRYLLFCTPVIFFLGDIKDYFKKGEFTDTTLNYMFFVTKCFPRTLLVILCLGIAGGAYGRHTSGAAAASILLMIILLFLVSYAHKCIK